MRVDALDSAGLLAAADFLAAQPAKPPPWTASKSKVATCLHGRLQVLRSGKLAPYDPGERPEPEFYLAYFGAHWCGPCRRFSPGLVTAYTRLKALDPERFEVIFMSEDRDRSEQLRYATEVGMPWPILKYSAIGSAGPIERWAGRGIPCLVVLTREGEVVFHSYHGEEYVGPDEVLTRFEQLLKASLDESDFTRRVRHRLAVVQHVRAAGAGDSPPKPYLIGLNKSHHQSLTAKVLNATLEIDGEGHVTEARFAPDVSAMVAYDLEREAEAWLFLPGVRAGKPVAQKLLLPLSF